MVAFSGVAIVQAIFQQGWLAAGANGKESMDGPGRRLGDAGERPVSPPSLLATSSFIPDALAQSTTRPARHRPPQDSERSSSFSSALRSARDHHRTGPDADARVRTEAKPVQCSDHERLRRRPSQPSGMGCSSGANVRSRSSFVADALTVASAGTRALFFGCFDSPSVKQ